MHTYNVQCILLYIVYVYSTAARVYVVSSIIQHNKNKRCFTIEKVWRTLYYYRILCITVNATATGRFSPRYQ